MCGCLRASLAPTEARQCRTSILVLIFENMVEISLYSLILIEQYLKQETDEDYKKTVTELMILSDNFLWLC